MEYKINPCEINNIFAVPASVVDEHLRLAGSAQLKVLLWTLRHAKHVNATIDELSDELGIDRADVIDAMQFWLDRGVFIKDSTQSDTTSAAKPKKKKPEPTPQFVVPVEAAPRTVVAAEIPVIQPSHEQIAARCKENRDLRELFEEVQNRLGRTIGYEGQSLLLMLYDSYGLPIPVILMAVEYAVSQGKTSIRYIAGIGKQWCEKEIDTLEKALEYIDEMNSCDKLWEKFCELTGNKNPRPTATQRKFLSSWSGEMGFSMDVIYLAYEEMADHTEKFSMQYMNKVLLNWHKEGLKTCDEIEKAKQERLSSKAEAKSTINPLPKTAGASYDLDQHEQRAKFSPPVYNKKKAEN